MMVITVGHHGSKMFADIRRIHICIALFIGAMFPLSLGYAFELAWLWFDKTHPIVTTKWEILERDDFSVTLRIEGERFRPECSFVRIKAYALVKDTAVIDLPRQRIDRPEIGRSLALGKRAFGDWRVWLNHPGTEKLQMVIEHRCKWRNVSTVLAEVPL